MKAKDILYIAVAIVILLPAVFLILGESDKYIGLTNLIGFIYAYVLYKLSFTKLGKKIVRSFIKLSVYL